jgi:hypothetical protein
MFSVQSRGDRSVLLDRTGRPLEVDFWFSRAADRGNEISAENLAKVEQSIDGERAQNYPDIDENAS